MLVPAGVARVGPRQAPGLALERGGEQQRLAISGRQRDELVHDRPEAHVEHPVGLVEHEHLDLAERDGAAVEQVDEPTRRGDQHVGAARGSDLWVDASAAVDGRDGQPAGVCDRAELVGYLGRELARRREDQCARCSGATAGLRAWLDAIDERDPERERLARAGGGLDEHVVVVKYVADHQLLDGEWALDSPRAQGRGYGLGHAEVGECGLLHVMLLAARRKMTHGPTDGGGDSTVPNRAVRLQEQEPRERRRRPHRSP